MNGYLIRAEMAARGIKVKDIAAELRVRGAAVSQVIHGSTVSARIQNAIASALGKPVDEVFPPEQKKGGVRLPAP